MITITKGRLLTIKQWRETYGHGSNVVLPAEEAEELARIALVSLEAGPVAVSDDMAYAFHHALSDSSPGADEVEEIKAGLRAAFANVTIQPEPVVPDEIALAIENLKQKLVECNRYNYCADAVKGVEDACHAAMLQGIQPVSQTYKLPVNTPCQDAPAHIWLQTAGVWPEDGELSELTWCSHNQHHDDTLYVRADLVNGNSPVTPGGWISCSDRMPEDTKMLLAFSQGEIVAAYWNWVVNPIDYKKYRAFTYLSGNILDDVTHWMPLPEPPQEVNHG
ncbi:DUF551 domain-containing protein [Escherichia coli]|nr:DUF551 domain-containing protein [Escherichia coli]EET3820294.1 DUF551 domain-containing protein [Escherichia coli]EEV4695122.1 DUF551 domain-containing protein [Escherichia coli]EEW5055096.1 DUF551 domain-containing protein [Escherichia coli]EEX6397893.1 DUF551 domain-containing protein [Escherichia coli]